MNVFLFSGLGKWGMAPVSSSFPSVSRDDLWFRLCFFVFLLFFFFFLHQSGNWVSVGDKAGLWVEGPPPTSPWFDSVSVCEKTIFSLKQ